MPVYNSLKNEKVTSTPLCYFSGNIVYLIIIVCVILLLILMFGLNNKLSRVKVQLDSCRSSMRSI